MEKMQEFLADKKERASKRSPKYGMRKLSIGFVSCFLGCMIFMAPGQIHAQVETNKDQAPLVAVEAAAQEAPKAEALVEEKAAAPATVEANGEGEEAQAEANVEPLTDEKENKTEETTPTTEEIKDEKEIKEENSDVTEEDKKLVENVNELELSAEEEKDAQLAEEATQGTDISNNIINPRVSIRTQNTTTPGTLDAGLGEQLTWGVSFTTPEGTKEGDTFTVKLSDNMSLKGLEPDTDYALPVKFGDKIIANAKRIDRQTIQYTFTKEINDLKYARIYIINSAQENKDVVQNSGNQTFKINVGEKEEAKDEQDINVDFGKLYHSEQSENVNGKSQFTEFNPETGEFTQVFYLNPESKEIKTSSTNDQNGREFGKVGFLLASPHDADKPRSVDYLANNTTIEVKKLPKGAKLPDAIIENPEGAQPATNVHGEFREFKGDPMYTMNFGGGNKIDSPYVVVVKGHANKIDGKYTELYSIGTLYGDGEASLFLDNLYTVQENSTGSEGEKETLGYFKEHHIYITKENGTEKSRFEIPGATVSGTADEYYYTDKNEIPGYHFVKVDTDSLKNNPAYNENGEIKQGHFEVGKTKEVTYIYEKDIKKGSFKETHVYITKDFDGNVVEDKTITEAGKSSEGTTDKTYESSKVDKAGYVLEKVTADEGSDEVTISKDGKSVEAGNYVEDKELAVTYEYVKQPGRFVEHHIYKTVDKYGKVVSTDKTVNNPKEGEPAKEGFSNEKITTAQRPEDGYTFDSETTLESENYVPGKVLEKTYIYTKTEEEPVAKTGKFKETHVYITKDFDGNVVEDKTITEAGKSSEGTTDKTYESSKVDKAGYVLEKVTADEGSDEVTISKDGKSVEAGNYVEDKELAVTYEYVKQPGRFVEHHIYKTVDKEGNVVTTDKTVNLPKDGQDPFEGYSYDSVSTKQRAEEGYTFKEATEIKLQNDDSEKTYTNYVPGKTLEKTYIYVKEQEEPQPEPVEQTYSLGDRVWIDDNKDGLQTEGEKGLEGATVKLTGGDLTEEKTTTTDANGNYKFEGLKNGDYKVTFTIPEGYEATKSDQGGDDAKDSDGTEVTVTIKDADNMTVDLGLVKKETPVTEPEKPNPNKDPKENEDPKPSEPSTPRTPDPRPNTNPGPKEPKNPIVEEPKDPSPVEEKEKDPAPKEENPVQKPVEEVKEVPNKPVEVEKKQVPPKASDDARAPQTFDPGVASYLGLAGLASGFMAYLEDRKRKNK